MIHELKLDKKWFDSVVNGQKRFEIRKDDRIFKVGDILTLKEVERTSDNSIDYTGNEVQVKITSILKHEDFPEGIQEGYVVLSIDLKLLDVMHDREVLFTRQ